MNLWIMFFAAALAVIIAGTRVAIYGDIIALKSGLGQAMVGAVIIAGFTTLPELVTVTSATYIGAVDIAVGTVFGSIIFNLAMLALMDLMQGSGPLLYEVHIRHLLKALMGIMLLVVVALFILINYFNYFDFNFLGIGLGSLALICLYIIGTRLNYRYEKYRVKEKIEEKTIKSDITLKAVIPKFIAAGFVIIVAGIILSSTADRIASVTGIEQTFIGTIMVAAATSLPEIATLLAAVKIGAYNMAASNVFGSNIYNLMILVIADMVYRPGPILAAVSITNVVTALIGVIMSLIVVTGLFYRSKKSFFLLGWDSITIIVIYLFGIYLIFKMGVVI